jgi:hypothetical protein
MAKYDAARIAETATPLVDGASGVEPTCDEFGRLILPLSSGGATSAKQDDLLAKFTDGLIDNNIGAAVSKTVKSGAGRLLGFTVRHADASTLYFWLFNNTAASGTQLLIPFLVPASSQIFIGTDLLTTKGIAFSTGLTYGLSTSATSYTAYGTAANVFVSMVYA